MPVTSTTPTVALTLPTDAESVGRARRALHQAGLEADLDHTVTLLTSELVTNAVRHAGDHGDLRLEAFLGGDFARVDVVDRGTGFDPAVRHGAQGFGLRLVDKLASRWGVEHEDDGSRVWFEVDRRRRRFDRD